MVGASSIRENYTPVKLSAAECRNYFAARVPSLRGDKNRARAACPLCDATNVSTLSVDFAKGGLFHCFRCGSGGDVFALEMALTNADFCTARDAVYSIVGRPLSQSRHESPSELRLRVERANRARMRAGEVLRFRDSCLWALKFERNDCYTIERRAAKIYLSSRDDAEQRELAAEICHLFSKRAFEFEEAIRRIESASMPDLLTAHRRMKAASQNRGAA